MSEENNKKPDKPIVPISTKPIARSPLTEMRHKEIAQDHLPKSEPKKIPDGKRKDD
jgi:hypothetical protein